MTKLLGYKGKEVGDGRNEDLQNTSVDEASAKLKSATHEAYRNGDPTPAEAKLTQTILERVPELNDKYVVVLLDKSTYVNDEPRKESKASSLAGSES